MGIANPMTQTRLLKALREKGMNRQDLLAKLRLGGYKLSSTQIGQIVNGTLVPTEQIKKQIALIVGKDLNLLFPRMYTREELMGELFKSEGR